MCSRQMRACSGKRQRRGHIRMRCLAWRDVGHAQLRGKCTYLCRGSQAWKFISSHFKPCSAAILLQTSGENGSMLRELALSGLERTVMPSTRTAADLDAGIGENGSMLRELALSGLEWAGIAVDRAANDATIRGRTGEVQAPGSRVKVRPCTLVCCASWLSGARASTCVCRLIALGPS